MSKSRTTFVRFYCIPVKNFSTVKTSVIIIAVSPLGMAIEEIIASFAYCRFLEMRRQKWSCSVTALTINEGSSFLRITELFFVDRPVIDDLLSHLSGSAAWRSAPKPEEPRNSPLIGKDGRSQSFRLPSKSLQNILAVCRSRETSLQTSRGLIPIEFDGASILLLQSNSMALSIDISVLSELPEDWISVSKHLRINSIRREAKIQNLHNGETSTVDEIFNSLISNLGESQERLNRVSIDDFEFNSFGYLNTSGGSAEAYEKFARLILTGVASSAFFEDDCPIIDKNQVLAYTEHSQFLASKNHSFFITHNAPDNEFFKNTMADHLRGPYFNIFVLIAFQYLFIVECRDRLTSILSMKNGEKQSDAAEELVQKTARLESWFLEQSASSGFKSVSFKDHHYRYHHFLQTIFRVDDLIQELEGQISQIRENYFVSRAVAREKRDDRTANLVTLLTVVILPLQVILTVFQGQVGRIGFITGLSPDQVLGITLSTLLALTAVTIWLRNR